MRLKFWHARQCRSRPLKALFTLVFHCARVRFKDGKRAVSLSACRALGASVGLYAGNHSQVALGRRCSLWLVLLVSRGNEFHKVGGISVSKMKETVPSRQRAGRSRLKVTRTKSSQSDPVEEGLHVRHYPACLGRRGKCHGEMLNGSHRRDPQRSCTRSLVSCPGPGVACFRAKVPRPARVLLWVTPSKGFDLNQRWICPVAMGVPDADGEMGPLRMCLEHSSQHR